MFNLLKKDNAFSGLEAGIVLIAFVTVAAIFSYVILGTGFVVTDKTQQVTQSGVKESSGILYPEGSVYGELDGNKQLDKVFFSIAIPEQGMDQDISKMLIIYTESDEGDPIKFEYGGSNPGVHQFGIEGSHIMREGEKRMVRLIDVDGPTEGEFFTIEMRPEIGSAASLKRWIPAGYTGGVLL